MKKKKLRIAIAWLASFALWTALVSLADVRAIGPEGSVVGFATLNGSVHKLTGVNWLLYTVTDWLGLVPVAVALGFAVLGLAQLISRKSLWRVDRSIFALGIFYVEVVVAYLFFEAVVINYRPVLIDGRLEASYPSSTTMLVMCVMPTAAIQLNARIKNNLLRRIATTSIVAFTAFMVMVRLVSGVHWVTDIVGGALLSAGLVEGYRAFS